MYGAEADFFSDLDGTKPFDFYPLTDDKSSPAPVSFLEEKISSAMNELSNNEQSGKNTIVYLGGDARVCAALAPYFIQKFGFTPEEIKMKSFWNPDKVREE